MAKRPKDQEHRRVAFVRDMLDLVLEGADANLVGDPNKFFDHGRALPLSIRLVRAFSQAGWDMVIQRASWRHVDGVKLRMGLEDFVTTCLVGAGKDVLERMIHKDDAVAEGARAEVAMRIARYFHAQGVVARRRSPD